MSKSVVKSTINVRKPFSKERVGVEKN